MYKRMSFKLHASIIVEDLGRNENTSISRTDYIYQLTQPVNFFKRSKNKQYFARIENVRIPISFYNINANFNTFVIDEHCTPLIVTVAQRNYTLDDLLPQFQSATAPHIPSNPVAS